MVLAENVFSDKRLMVMDTMFVPAICPVADRYGHCMRLRYTRRSLYWIRFVAHDNAVLSMSG
jgi:hypothetical protein